MPLRGWIIITVVQINSEGKVEGRVKIARVPNHSASLSWRKYLLTFSVVTIFVATTQTQRCFLHFIIHTFLSHNSLPVASSEPLLSIVSHISIIFSFSCTLFRTQHNKGLRIPYCTVRVPYANTSKVVFYSYSSGNNTKNEKKVPVRYSSIL